MIIAQGKRGTSAALGCGLKNFLFFPFGLAHRRRAKPKGKRSGGGAAISPEMMRTMASTWHVTVSAEYPGEDELLRYEGKG